MAEAKVLVVDDSAAMRALFCDILEKTPAISVVGTASNADEARDQISELRPDVLTLDVEMPGMSGIDFLEEVMGSKPMPVVMLSSITQSGTGTAQRAMELGAVACFPKPVNTSQENFNKAVADLGKIVLDAVNDDGAPAPVEEGPAFTPNGQIIALSGGSTCADALKQIVTGLPANCAPMLVVLDCGPSEGSALLGTLSSVAACKVQPAKDGELLEPGIVHLAYDDTHHVIIEAGDPPKLKMVDRSPVGGARPSADLLFGGLARTNVGCIAGLLEGDGEDGAKGLKMLNAGGFKTLLQEASLAGSNARIEAARRLGASNLSLKAEEVASRLIELTSAQR